MKRELFEKRIQKYYQGEITLCEKLQREDVDLKAQFAVKHTPCGHTWDVSGATLMMSSAGCPECANERRKEVFDQYRHSPKTTEAFLQEMKEKYGEKYRLIGKYERANIKIRIHCNDCSHEWDVMPSSFLTRNGCPECARQSMLDKAGFLDKLNTQFHGTIELVGKYNGMLKELLFHCRECDETWSDIGLHLIRRKNGCPKCHPRVTSHENFEAQVKKISNGMYKVKGQYEGATERVEIECLHCHRTFSPVARYVASGQTKCKCQRRNAVTAKMFEKRAKTKLNKKIKVLQFSGLQNPAQIQFAECKHVVLVTNPNAFLQGTGGCPTCREKKKGEKHELIVQ